MNIYWIDLFAGAGGTTTGIEMANANAKVIACVNHDANAIAAHTANHPDCVHFTEDIRDFAVVLKLKELVDNLREKEPDCIINIWASLECTNFSNAKGGLPRDADSRTLAEHLFMYLEELNPSYLYIENVREFMAWGPLDENGKPISRLNGKEYLKWIKNIKSFGYNHDWKMLNSADYGAHTARTRYFGVFAKDGFPILWPDATHAKNVTSEGFFESTLDQWKSIKDCLDFSDLGKSIFDRKKPLSDNTIKRIIKGLIKFHREKYFITSYYGNGQAHSIDAPCPTITTVDRFAANWVHYDYSSFTGTKLSDPAGTITTTPKHNLVTAWISDTQFGRVGKSIEDPCFTLIARMDKKPPYFTIAQFGKNKTSIKLEDSETVVELKTLMKKLSIADISMRMLKLDELKIIQGFPKDYVLKGTIADQKKQIGNSVVPIISKVLAEANAQGLMSLNQVS